MCTWVVLAMPLQAQVSPFAGGWALQSDASELNFQSIKDATKVETSGFAAFAGAIDPTGQAEISILLDSIDTRIDLRNVRMRFLFFETFDNPKAVITARMNPDQFSDLTALRRKRVMLPFTLELHGVSKAYEAEVIVTLLTDDLISVASHVPVPVLAMDHDLSLGVEKLQEAAGVSITPLASVTFDFVFQRGRVSRAVQTAPVTETPTHAALEPQGNFDTAACAGRLEILSRSGNIFFNPASARLTDQSVPMLTSVVDIVVRCPDLSIVVEGHTDSDGSAASNLSLSQRRAAAVKSYLVAQGIDNSRVRSVGFGEARPLVENTSSANKARNRRIEFAVAND